MKNIIKKILLIGIVLMGILGVAVCNIQLNRTIYCNEIHMKASEESYRNKKNEYNLDDMENKLDLLQDEISNPNKYKKDDSDLELSARVPPYRLLFSLAPIDIRIESQNYKLCLNEKVISNFQLENINKMKDIKTDFSQCNEKIESCKIKIGEWKEKLSSFIK